MARTRMIEPGFFLNERLAGLPSHARLLFIGLWQLADREGRLEDRPRRIKAEVFPWEEVDVDELLWVLASREGLRPKEEPFIVRYDVDGLPLIAISGFLKHQKPHIREVQSTLPPPAKGKTRAKEGSPKASLGQTLGTPKASLGGNGVPSEERSAQGQPKVSPGQAQGSIKASPRRPVTVTVTESVTDPDPGSAPAREAGGWPSDLLTEIRTACGKTDLDHDWQLFVGRTLRQPQEKRIAGGRQFLDGGYAHSGSVNDPLSYCARMIEKNRGAQTDGAGAGDQSYGERMRAKGRAAIADMEQARRDAAKHPRIRNGKA